MPCALTSTQNVKIAFNINDCKGCLTLRACFSIIKKLNKMNYQHEPCPCAKCLIKSMCDNSCKDFLIYSHKRIEALRKKNRQNILRKKIECKYKETEYESDSNWNFRVGANNK